MFGKVNLKLYFDSLHCFDLAFYFQKDFENLIRQTWWNRGLNIEKQGRVVGYFDWFGAGFSLTIKQGLHMATLRRLMPRLVADVFV
ncbi:coproporphyrinogen oxidase [Neisseria sp. CP9]|jgi:hypothetical protein|uniref:coproporphyrinogen oxidase n=1 Tax=unclassified Neisseria TaxID=2623750 RepID=UPI003139398D